MLILFRREGGRGFTLVELAIVVVVVGLLLGASLIPMRALEERRQLREETRQMEVVRDAIVGYALRHRTRERVVVFKTLRFFGRMNFEWSFRLPAGRPYLPCPDWDGDGVEDRLPAGAAGFVQGMEVKPDLTVTATIGYRSEPRNFLEWRSEDFSFERPYGECRVSRGAVPWRTLGVEPSDRWGNRHTYFADPVFSNAIFGFDRQTVADIFDPRLPDAPGLLPARRGVSRLGLGVARFSADCPAVICDGGRAGDCSSFFSGDDTRQCVWRADLANLILKAGAVTKQGISGRRRFEAGAVTNGLPFVLVSHGPNGRFAVNHWATLNAPLDAAGNQGPVCNESAWSEPGQDGNNVVPRGNRGLSQEAANGSRFAPLRSGRGCTQVSERREDGQELEFNSSFFVWNPPGTGDGFDDLLLWMTREELSVAVPGVIPRLPQMIVPYFP